MTLTFENGTKKEAVLLSRSENRMRVIVRGSEDVVELTETNGAWVFEGSAPVQVEFAWEKKTRAEIVEEADCLCSQELASRLIDMLHQGDGEEAPKREKAPRVMAAGKSGFVEYVN